MNNDQKELRMLAENLEEAVAFLKDLEAIKKLHARYAYLVDEGRMDEVADLFVEEGVADWGGTRGRYEGKEAIAAFFKERIPRAASMLRHMFVQPDIEVKGNRAQAKWYMFGFGTYNLPEGPAPAWNHGKYENTLVKENGEWKFKHLKFMFTFQTPYHEGWVKCPTLMPTEFRDK
jgi:hypothetical protein